MPPFRLLLTLALLLPLAACLDLLSVHPLAAGGNLAADAALAGEWVSTTSGLKASALVRPTSGIEKTYDIIWIPGEPDEVPLRLTGRLARLSQRLVLDLVKSEHPDMGLSAHFFFLYDRQGDTLKLHWLDSEWLRAEAARPGLLPHLLVSGRPVLTADTPALAAFLAERALDPRAVSDTLDFRRGH